MADQIGGRRKTYQRIGSCQDARVGREHIGGERRDRHRGAGDQIDLLEERVKAIRELLSDQVHLGTIRPAHGHLEFAKGR
jgi:hypothetical protein